MLPDLKARIATLYTAAQTAQARGALEQAADGYRRVLDLAPNLPEAHFQLARIALAQGRPEDGLAPLEAALALRPQEPAILTLAADLRARCGDIDGAAQAHDALIARDPRALKPRADKAHFLQLAGRFDAAETLFRKLLRQNPYEGQLYRMFVGGTRLARGDPLIAAMLKAMKHPRLTDNSRMHLGFALAKAMEDTGQADKVFGYLRLANGLQQRAFPFDRAERLAELDHVLAAQEGLRPLPVSADTPRPILVCGMPRSGTTLAEQIIAAHSQVRAGGEMGHALRLAYQGFGAGPRFSLAGATPESLGRYAAAYRQAARASTHADAPCVTDKAIQSYMVFGLIHAAMPDARLIVVQRDPRDIALSIYKNPFAEGTHRYANDLADIAWMIRQFQRCVAHWKERLPGLIHEIRYEDLVSDPEAQSRALIAAAGLAWEDGCLDFHRSTSTVKTLSVAQVRQPIHAGRREAWRRYEAEMQPFTEAWEALA